MLKKAISSLLSFILLFGLMIVPVGAIDNTANGTQKVYVVGDDWGAGVTKTIITFDKTINADSVSPEDFIVEQTAGTTTSQRTILDAYVSNENGEKVTEDSNVVTIEMYISPVEGNPIVYANSQNNWADPFELNVTLAPDATLMSGQETITTINVEKTVDVAGDGKICPQIEDFVQGKFTYDSTTVQYSLYSPEEDGHKNALVIWNHGGGETGNDVEMALLANKATALGDEEFQKVMDGAYILTPQRQSGASSTASAETIYQLILKLLKENPDIDPNRVIVGGCSAGGAMTMTMLFAHPELYAAAYPICPATTSANVTDEMIESIKDVPIWFVHADNDPTVIPEKTSHDLARRLKAVGAEVHTSYFPDVRDTSGRFYQTADGDFTTENTKIEYQYPGHWSWIYFYNNECFDDENGTNLWQWLSVQTNEVKEVVSGSQKAYIIGDDWGPAVTKTVITLDKTVSADSLNKDDFTVVEKKNVTNWTTMQEEIGTADRQVLDVYPCDVNGNKVDGDSNIIAIEMYVDPNTGSPFIYRLGSGFNYWCDTYELHVTLADNSALTLADGTEVDSLSVAPAIDLKGDDKIVPQVDGVFDINQEYKASDGTIYNFADYTPVADDKKNALVIWLHGAGEGTDKGVNDSYIDLLGNEVTAFVSDEFQELFEGAYVLVPQAPTMWMDGGDGEYQNGDIGSRYKDSLFEMIQKYVADHPDIDPNRIIIGGCSNGGYMTMEMILAHPDYFAAAFPICEAFYDEYITDEQIESLVDLPIWFTYAKNDGTVDPTLCSEPTIERLLKAGAKNVHVSAFEDVHDTTGRFVDEDGNPHQYSGHWSWIYFDNNECYEGELNAWQWLSKQVKSAATAVEPGVDTTKPGTTTSVKTGDDVALMGLGILVVLSAGTYTVARKRFH
ncbi:prolyl oligopeptidase family serine peptidase [Thomasclavelia sp.]|uniref:prolyl oligopeptidase family serine peptidase n=1 Tax=Thomasclavelia sp. TaxID=3025757 RepID=UPI0025EDCA36|nr:prolyl oligopeptidase family serine peptidase [Thomasclavelia sp.]